MLSPILDAIAAEGNVRVVKVNADENPATAIRFGVRGIPLMLFFRDGQPVGRILGAVPRHRIEAALEAFKALRGLELKPTVCLSGE
jgi:thioredoxin 1